MKALHHQTILSMLLILGSGIGFEAAVSSAKAEEKAPEVEFPFVIQPELGATEFATGDNIVITSVRGDRSHLEPSGRYLVEGTYTLASGESADLALHTTSRGPSGPSPVLDDQHAKVANGSGEFHLKKTLRDDGWLHISFYVHGHSHGGIYFGESGNENTILRNKGWSDFSNSSSDKRPAQQSATSATGGSDLVNPANLAILAYLGNPVPAPADMDARYSRSNLVAAFTELSKKANWQIKMLNVDESEFPFLTYGVLEGDFGLLEKGLREMNGYAYGGSVSGHTHDRRTYFALNMVPREQYPSGSSTACNRRLMVRLQMLADAAAQQAE